MRLLGSQTPTVNESSKSKPGRTGTLRQQQQCEEQHDLSRNMIIITSVVMPPSLLGIYMYNMVSMNPTKISLLIRLPFHGRWEDK